MAFSETQLDCIKNNIPSEVEGKLEDLIENGQLFFKALENLQGEECDRLIISTGYGKNEEGQLLLNFGPLNRNGGHRRLNVLFTRAKKSIQLVTSLKSEDLIISQNDSLNLLRLYLRALENPIENDETPFPLGVNFVKDDLNKEQPILRLSQIFKKNLNANELVTLHRVLEGRKWKVIYQ